MSDSAQILPEIKTGFFYILEKLVNLPLADAPRTKKSIKNLSGKVLKIVATDLKQEVFLICRDKLELHGIYGGKADVIISAGSPYLMRLMFNDNPEFLFSDYITVSGDIDTAGAYQELFIKLKDDSEDMLEGVIGLKASNLVSGGFGDFANWFADTSRRFLDMAGEFVKDEANITPHAFEVDDFIVGVDELRSRLDILEARVNRLLS